MDISEITKVASRKRLNADAEKLREKVSRETAKIIKLKVAQDTAYWDLKEKLQQVEGNHERLQQNMVEIQMQHEAISGQYQDELRLRPDTLNKLSSTREICDVLEEYSERLKDTLSRCKSDQASLCEAYQKSGKLVRDMKLHHERSEERNKQIIDSLKEKVNTSNEHQNQLLQHLSAAKRQADAELSEARMQLATAHAQKDQLSAAVGELGRHLEQNKNEIQMKDSAIANIQKETKQLIQDFTAQHQELKCTISKKDKELQEAKEAIEALRRAVSNQEDFAAGLREQNSRLQDQLVAVEGQLQAAKEEQKQLLIENGNTKQEVDVLKETIGTLEENKENLEKLVNEKVDAITAAELTIERMQARISELEAEKTSLESELQLAREQGSAQRAQISDLHANNQQLQNTVDHLNTAFNTNREDNEAKIRELSASIDDKEKELKIRAGTIAQLMSEVNTASETAGKLEATLQRLRKEADDEREAAKDRESQQARAIEHLQMQVSEKESELSKQMTIILDMRNEKARLQEKIQGMQSKIDNIQKELSGPHRKLPAGDAPELDDNALAFAPTPRAPPNTDPRQQNLMKSPKLRPQPANRNESDKLDSMLFSIFSDTSLDDDSNMIDPREVNRRFEALARGEPLQPASLNDLKRRKAPSGGLKTIQEEDHMSLSQIKKNKKGDEPRKFFKNARTENKIKKIK